MYLKLIMPIIFLLYEQKQKEDLFDLPLFLI